MGVLDWLKQIFSPEEEEKEARELLLSEVEGFISQQSETIKTVKERAEGFRSDIISRFNNVRELINGLKSTEPSLKGDYPEKIFIVGKSIKEKYCGDVSRVTAGFSDSIETFLGETRSALKTCNLDASKTELLGMLHEPEMNRLSKELNGLKQVLDDFERFVKKDLKVVRGQDAVGNLLVEVSAAKLSVENCIKRISDIKNTFEQTQVKRDGLGKKLEELKKEKEDAVVEVDAEIRDYEEKNKKIISDVDEKFSSIRKVLKKYKYLVSINEYEGDSKLINDYLKSPSTAFLSDEALGALKMLDGLKHAMGIDIPVDEKEKQKILADIDSLSAEYLAGLQKQTRINSGYLQEIHGRRTETLTPLVFREKALEREFSEAERELAKAREELEKQEKVRMKLEGELAEKTKRLESAAGEASGQKVLIKV